MGYLNLICLATERVVEEHIAMLAQELPPVRIGHDVAPRNVSTEFARDKASCRQFPTRSMRDAPSLAEAIELLFEIAS